MFKKLFKKIFEFFLKRYKSASHELQKKSEVFLLITFSGVILLSVITILELSFGQPIKLVLPFLFGVFFSVLILILLKAGRYEFSSILLIFGLLVMQTIAVIIDKYDNPFDVYRYSFIITTLIFVNGIISYTRRQLILINLTGLVGIIFFYLYRHVYQLKNYDDRVVLMSFIASLSVFIFFIAMSYFTLKLTKTMINIIKSREEEVTKERDESLKMLNVIEVYTKTSVVRKIQEGIDPITLPPEKRNLAILFCDIRNFTKMSENLEPSKVIEMLNPYFAMMNEVIIQNSGEIDKLMGDCIMALFESPDDALKAGIEIRAYLLQNDFNINNGIGIHYGPVIIGNIGSPWKLDYTVIGDVVNVASRLEALSKIYGASIVVSDTVKDNLVSNFELIELDVVMVKGRNAPTKIFGYYDELSFVPNQILTKFKSSLSDAFKYYLEGNFERALEIYNKISNHINESRYPSISYLEFYKNRCLELIIKKDEGQIKNWDGIYNFSEKH